MLQLHAKYGDVVRLGPRVLSFGQPQAMKDIYSPGQGFKKVSESYCRSVNQPDDHETTIDLWPTFDC